ncbi:MAG: hypothetical protein HOV80_03990 [Polyangiaceae bacterium]|nr:hypothetical protein [Polyangiaceae bacterium]
MSITRAEWRPGWYELDQSLEVGVTAELAFFLRPQNSAPEDSLLFYNTLWSPKDAMIATGTVSRITHPKLGEIQKVDCRGLDYIFVLPDGHEFVVNAEEEPGRLYEKTTDGWSPSAAQMDSWTLEVELTDLSALRLASE